MNFVEILHHTIFGGLAAVGFGVLFNCPPRFLLSCFCAGALALFVRSVALEGQLSLPVASFIAALVLAVGTRFAWRLPSMAISILTVVGCIPMIPGSLAAQGLKSIFGLLQAAPADRAVFALTGLADLTIVTATLLGMGAALLLPTLIFPRKQKAVA